MKDYQNYNYKGNGKSQYNYTDSIEEKINNIEIQLFSLDKKLDSYFLSIDEKLNKIIRSDSNG